MLEAWNKHDPDRYVKLLDEKYMVADESARRDARLLGQSDQERQGWHDWIYWDTGHLLRQLGVLPGS